MVEIPKIGHFLKKETFKEIIIELNIFTKDNIDTIIDYEKYKPIIGKTMYEIFKKYKNILSKSQATQKTIKIMKKILIRDNKNKFFEHKNKNKIINNNIKNIIPSVDNNNIKNIMPPVDNNKIKNIIPPVDNINNELKIRPKYEKRFHQISEKKKELPIDLQKNPIQNRQDDYFNKHIIYQDIIIDSRDRNINIHPNPNNYDVDLEKYIHNIITIELISMDVPNSEYIINDHNNLLHFEETNNTELMITIPVGNYTINSLVNSIETQLNIVGSSTYKVTESENKITISSDLTGGSNIFNLNFNGRIQKTENIYKENSIAEIIGYNSVDLTGNNNYTSNNIIMLNMENKVYLEIFGLNNIDKNEQKVSDKFALLTLNSNKGEYTYIKNTNNNVQYIYYTHTPLGLQKIKIKFVKENNKLYNFYGLDHNIHFRISYN